MTSAFRTMPIFRAGSLGIFTMGGDAVRLTGAMRSVWEAQTDLWDALYPAAIALGDPFNAARRARALAILESLPMRVQGKILAAYGRKNGPGAPNQPDRSAA